MSLHWPSDRMARTTFPSTSALGRTQRSLLCFLAHSCVHCYLLVRTGNSSYKITDAQAAMSSRYDIHRLVMRCSGNLAPASFRQVSSSCALTTGVHPTSLLTHPPVHMAVNSRGELVHQLESHDIYQTCNSVTQLQLRRISL